MTPSELQEKDCSGAHAGSTAFSEAAGNIPELAQLLRDTVAKKEALPLLECSRA
jgi:hypothetical protein